MKGDGKGGGGGAVERGRVEGGRVGGWEGSNVRGFPVSQGRRGSESE
jgi:hypothetical protein